MYICVILPVRERPEQALIPYLLTTLKYYTYRMRIKVELKTDEQTHFQHMGASAKGRKHWLKAFRI